MYTPAPRAARSTRGVKPLAVRCRQMLWCRNISFAFRCARHWLACDRGCAPSGFFLSKMRLDHSIPPSSGCRATQCRTGRQAPLRQNAAVDHGLLKQVCRPEIAKKGPGSTYATMHKTSPSLSFRRSAAQRAASWCGPPPLSRRNRQAAFSDRSARSGCGRNASACMMISARHT